MSKSKQKKKVQFANSTEQITPTKSKITTAAAQKAAATRPLLFHKGNYMMILAGLGLIFVGYVLMSGGHMPDSETWDESIIYSTRRTLIAPILILAGLGLEIYAVFKK